MNSGIQVLIFLISFIYGIVFCFLSKINILITKKLSIFLKVLINLIFVLDIVLLYIYIIYSINNGIFHISFLIVLIMGYVLIEYNYNNIVYLCQKLTKKIKKIKNS